MTEEEKINLFDKLTDFLQDIAEDEYAFEASELGMHAQSRDVYDGYALDALSIAEVFIFEEKNDLNEEEILNILDLEKDERGYFLAKDQALEEYSYGFEINVKEYYLKKELSKFKNFKYYNKENVLLFLLFKDDLELLDLEKDVKSEDEYVDIFKTKIKGLIQKKNDFNEEFVDVFVDIMKGSKNFYNSYIDSLKLLNILKKMENFKYVNNKIIKAIKSEDITKNLYFLCKEEDLHLDTDYMVRKISGHFNKDTLDKNELFKEFKRIIRNEVYEDKDFDLKDGNLTYRKNLINNINELERQVNSIESNSDENREFFLKLNETYNVFLTTFEFYNKYKNLIKSDKNFKMEKINYLEECYDEINKLVENSNLKKYVKKIIGSYNHLKSEENMAILKDLKERKISDKIIKKELKNIALIKTPEDLFLELEKISKTISENLNNHISLLNKIETNELNAELLYSYDNNKKNLVVTKDIKSSKYLCPSIWCITKSESFFNSYKGDGFNTVLFDFSRNSKDRFSIVGLSIKKSGSISAFDKNNYSVNVSEFLSKNEIDKIKEKVHILCLKEEIEKVKREEKKLIDTIDPIYVLNELKNKNVDNFEELIMMSLIKSKFKKEDTLLKIVNINKELNIDLMSVPDFVINMSSIKDEKVKFLISKNTKKEKKVFKKTNKMIK